MAIALVQVAQTFQTGAGGLTLAATFSSPVTSGNTVIVWAEGLTNESPSSVTDNIGGNTYVIYNTSPVGFGYGEAVGFNITGGPTVITAHWPTQNIASAACIYVAEYSGCGNTVNARNTISTTPVGSGGTILGPSIITTVDGCLILGFYGGFDGTGQNNPSAGWTGLSAFNAAFSAAGAYNGSTFQYWEVNEYQVQSSQGSINTSWVNNTGGSTTSTLATALAIAPPLIGIPVWLYRS